MVNLVQICNTLLDKIGKFMVNQFGDIDEFNQFNNYWHCVGYVGPYQRDYDGKFCYYADLTTILNDAKLLTPLVRENVVIGFKHRTSNNQPDDPFYGRLPVMVVYATYDEKDNIFSLLKSLDAKDIKWIDDNSYVSPSEEQLTSKKMTAQKVSSPYSLK